MKKLLVLSVLALGLLAVGSASGTGQVPLTGSIVRTWSDGTCGVQQCWVCDGPVQLDSVTIVVDTSDQRVDAVKLAPGCTGTIGTLDVVTYSGDGVKVAEGAHDLMVGGGDVFCRGKVADPTVHQDGIQVMGGSSITFSNLAIDCGRADEAKIDSNLFIGQGVGSSTPPTAVVCDHCWLGPWAAHTVSMGASVRSGLRNRSTVCPAKYANLALTVGDDVVKLVNQRTLMPATCPHVWFTWDGFDAPVRNTEAARLNVVWAGDLVNLGFDLGRSWGLDVLAGGYPVSAPIACPAGWVERRVAAAPAGSSAGLQFDGSYTYGWQTSASWAGTCRRFELQLDDDGPVHTADFRFR
jgi:hypothetical protein